MTLLEVLEACEFEDSSSSSPLGQLRQDGQLRAEGRRRGGGANQLLLYINLVASWQDSNYSST